MPVIKPLRAGDPSEIGSYRLAGRLGASTYLGEPDDGERVVVKVLPADVDPGRFLEAVAPLQDVSAFCTAQVLGSGTLEDGRPFVVSEYIDGPTLREAVAAGQRLSDAALHRFAVGTVTALVALHQLGSAHGEVGPDTVVLGPDGPRVIGFGPARAMASTGAATTRTVDVPAFAAPERLQGAAAGPAADLFSWAATIAYASSGRSPFDGGSMAGTVNRIAHAEPELPELGDLRELVLACLDKDPARRPPASDVLLRLVGETSFLTGTVPGSGPDTDEPPGGEAPAPPPAPPQVAAAGRRRGTVLVAVAAFVAGAVLSGGGVYALTGQRGTPPGPPPAALPATALPATAPPGTALPTTAAPPTQAGAVITAAPRITAGVTAAPVPSVARKADKDVKLPDIGATLHEHTSDAVRLAAYLQAKEPYHAFARDAAGAFKQAVEAEYSDDISLAFTFTPDGGLARGYHDGDTNGIDFYNDAGQVTRSMHWVGKPRNRDWFSPSGKLFYTVCPKGGELCVWNAETGVRVATVPGISSDAHLLGWFDEAHLLLQQPDKKNDERAEVRILNLVGDVSRVLADVNPLNGALNWAPVAR